MGKTGRHRFQVRISQHTTPYELAKNTYKNKWLRRLLGQGKKPLVALLDVATEDNWQEAERYWISKFSRLTNATLGGDGVNMTIELRDRMRRAREARGPYTLTEEHKRKLAEAKRGKPGNNLGKGGWKHSEEAKATIRTKTVAAWTPAMREAARQRRLGTHLSDATKAKIPGRPKS